MGINVNCKFNDQGAWCTNKLIKRSLLGLGARCCVDYPYSTGCEIREPHLRPNPSPPRPPQKLNVK